jgi:hypothetical protein
MWPSPLPPIPNLRQHDTIDNILICIIKRKLARYLFKRRPNEILNILLVFIYFVSRKYIITNFTLTETVQQGKREKKCFRSYQEISKLLTPFHHLCHCPRNTISTVAVQVSSGSSPVGFVVDKVALGQVSSEYFGFPCFSFHCLLHHLSSAAGTIGRTVADVPSGLSSIPFQALKFHAIVTNFIEKNPWETCLVKKVSRI